MSEKGFTHIDAAGNATMVDVTAKAIATRTAKARSIVELPASVMALLRDGEIHVAKGAVFQTAIIAGIMAAKKTGELIPLCHPLGLDACNIQIHVEDNNKVVITCTASLQAKTGVEMEALVGASLAALTIYDMCKAFGHSIVIRETRLIEKTGGKSDYKWQPE